MVIEAGTPELTSRWLKDVEAVAQKKEKISRENRRDAGTRCSCPHKSNLYTSSHSFTNIFPSSVIPSALMYIS